MSFALQPPAPPNFNVVGRNDLFERRRGALDLNIEIGREGGELDGQSEVKYFEPWLGFLRSLEFLRSRYLDCP